MGVGEHPAGTPCWIELGGPAAPELLDHYAALLGWTYDVNENVSGYVRGFAGTEKVAGFGGPAEPSPSRGWRVYLASDDLDRSLAEWRAAGGSVGEVRSMHDGRFAWLQDPWGIDTGLFESTIDPGTSAAGAPGCVAGWVLVVPDHAAASEFYRSACGPAFEDAVRLEEGDPTSAGWVVEVHATGAHGDVTDPRGNVVRLVAAK